MLFVVVAIQILDTNRADVNVRAQVLSNGLTIEESGSLRPTLLRSQERPIARHQAPLQSPDAFWANRKCQDEPTLNSAFKRFDEKGGRVDSTLLQNGFDNPRVALVFTIQDQMVHYRVNGSSFLHEQIAMRARDFAKLLRDLAKEVQLPNTSFVLSLTDGSPVTLPGMLRTEGTPGDDMLMIPRSLVDWGMAARNVARKPMAAPSQHQSFAVWRGSSTGLHSSIVWNSTLAIQPFTDQKGQLSVRYQVVLLAQQRPDLVDAGFTLMTQTTDDGKFTGYAKAHGLMKQFLNDDEQSKFSAVLVPDGNSVPDRLPRQLGYGKPLVFIHNWPMFNEFWYNELRPWQHYVPATLVGGVANLTAALERLRADPQLAKSIGNNGRQYLSDRLSENRLRCYLFKLLAEYAKRCHVIWQKGEKKDGWQSMDETGDESASETVDDATRQRIDHDAWQRIVASEAVHDLFVSQDPS